MWIATAVLAAAVAPALASGLAPVADAYLERYFATFPTRASAEGRYDRNHELEDLSPQRLEAWARFNRETRVALLADLGELSGDDRIDAELLLRQVERELLELEVLERPRRDPLFWTRPVADAVVFLLIREDAPLEERLAAVETRARLIPRLALQAQASLGAADPARVAPELCRIAASQAARSAGFYREGLQAAAPDPATRARLAEAGAAAGAALEHLAGFLSGLGERAGGSARLGQHYAASFRLWTGIEAGPLPVLQQAEAELARLRGEIASWARSVWEQVLPGEPLPSGDSAVVRRLFARVEEDRDADLAGYLESWRAHARALAVFVEEKQVVTLPEPVTLRIDTSPAFFLGQSVGGVYAPGAWAPDSDTFLFLPTPAPDASPEQADRLFRAFNRPFNQMIAAHELIPGHYLQARRAAQHPRRLRSVFSDAVYAEGWGTFCERLLLDQGWGGMLARAAHYKKQLENVARTIVDIRVHARGMSEQEVRRFLTDEALQDPQLASNMWVRTLTSAPQLVSYYLGDRDIQALYEEVRAARGASFRLIDFTDAMLSLGSVPVRHYRQQLLADPAQLERRLLR